MPFTTRAFTVGQKANDVEVWTQVYENFDYLVGRTAATGTGRIELENDLTISKGAASGNLYGTGLQFVSTASVAGNPGTGNTARLYVTRSGVSTGIASLTIDGYLSTANASTTVGERGLLDYDTIALRLSVANWSALGGVLSGQNVQTIALTKTASSDANALGAVTFGGTTADLNDLAVVSSGYQASQHSPTLRFTVSTGTTVINPVEGSTITATVQTFGWDYVDASGNVILAGATGLRMQTAATAASTIADGLSVYFGSAVGHTTGTYWDVKLNDVQEWQGLIYRRANYNDEGYSTGAGLVRISSTGMVNFTSEVTSFSVTNAPTTASTASGNVALWDGLPWETPNYLTTLALSSNDSTAYNAATNALDLSAAGSEGTWVIHVNGFLQVDTSGDYDIGMALLLGTSSTADAMTVLYELWTGMANLEGAFPDTIPLELHYVHAHTTATTGRHIRFGVKHNQRNAAATEFIDGLADLTAYRLVD